LERTVCIHGHFYQPPRENPWTGAVERQSSAEPYHDWNERITAECYAPNASSPILDGDGRVARKINNYARISFNFGPTLLAWMERHKPEVLRAIVKSDRESMRRFSGHGSAIAQIYNHMIMPLASRRDKATQAIWGLKDFSHRFGRVPEGMWLPETAVDLETLEVLADLGIKFTVLAPHQARRVKEIGRGEWLDVAGGKIDSSRAYLCPLPSGKSVNLFFYDGAISAEVAFGELLKSGEGFGRRLIQAFNGENRHELVHIATDGETFGHHRRHADMALAYCLHTIERDRSARLTNYGEYLEKHPPTDAVEIVENSSWSCAHGVERWRDNCGCHSGMHPDWTQAWRKPLRKAMDWLGGRLAEVYENEAAPCLRDPWEARNDYIEVILDPAAGCVEKFFRRHASRTLSSRERKKTLQLLEMQKNVLLSTTSCGWFFDDISGIETVQVMRYAARAIELAEETAGIDLEPEYRRMLEAATSNAHGSGARVYESFVKPGRSEPPPAEAR
jgi:alpha-amylase/alpha-mannosidase (GH57 family)